MGSISASRYDSHANSAVANSQNSPLLSLPAEIRNRIYSLVLGGNSIHIVFLSVSYRPDRIQHTLCRAEMSDADFVRAYKADGDMEDPKDCEVRHDRCVPKGEWWMPSDMPKLSLALLRTCRQIYKEAALLPYAENEFIFGPRFEPLHNCSDFVASLLATQRRAIKTLTFLNTNLTDNNLNATAVKSMTGVRKLTAIYDHTVSFLGNLRLSPDIMDCTRLL